MNHHDTLVLFFLLAIILIIVEIARIVREIDENGGQNTVEELLLATQQICRDIRESLRRKGLITPSGTYDNLPL